MPIVRHVGPELPAEKTGTMPAARRAVTASISESWAQPSWEIEQNQELLTATGARSGFGLWPSRFQGAIMNSRHVTYVSGVPKPEEFIDRHDIHWAPGATPIWFAPPSSPTMVPAVCVPCPYGSSGARLPGSVASYQL